MYGCCDVALRHLSFNASIRLHAYKSQVSIWAELVYEYAYLFYLCMMRRTLPLEQNNVNDGHNVLDESSHAKSMAATQRRIYSTVGT